METQVKLKSANDLSLRGFTIERILSKQQMDVLTSVVEASWRKQLRKAKGTEYPKCADLPGEQQNHHKYVSDKEHKENWNKNSRILSRREMNILEDEGIFEKLREIFGDFEITDEERIGHPNMYWRLVRPNKICDIGPIHRDEWFWLLDSKLENTTKMKRLKVWIPLIVEKGKNGLLVEVGSHIREDIKWHGEQRDGKLKPCIDMKESQLDMQLADVSLQEAIIFDDKLLHGGKINTGSKTRVSIEFTMDLGIAASTKAKPGD